MRDDIHKSAPVARHWQNFLGRCVREADRGDRALEGADAAIRKDLSREISPALLSELHRRCVDPRGDLFAGRFDGLSPSLLNNVLAQRLVGRLQLLERIGSDASPSLKVALTQVIRERMDAVGQAMAGHILKERGPQPKECVRAMAEAMRSLSASGYADELIESAGRIARPSPTAPQLSESLPLVE